MVSLLTLPCVDHNGQCIKHIGNLNLSSYQDTFSYNVNPFVQDVRAPCFRLINIMWAYRKSNNFKTSCPKRKIQAGLLYAYLFCVYRYDNISWTTVFTLRT